MKSEEMIKAIKEADQTLINAEKVAYDLAMCLRSRLRNVNKRWWSGSEVLKDLKAELKDFDARSGSWKS